MNIIEMLLNEMEQEAQTTRKMLSRVPADQLAWQPHVKSMPLQKLAVHVAELPSWVTMAVTTDELDFAKNPYETEDIKTNAHLLDYFERSLASGKEHLKNTSEEILKENWTLRNGEEILKENWTLRNGEEIYNTSTKLEVIRMAYSQIIHHRAQLGVYLRLLDIPIPGSYGPSADEVSFN